MERMTVSMTSIIHGDDEPLAASETFSAGTRNELIIGYIEFLEDLLDQLKVIRAELDG